MALPRLNDVPWYDLTIPSTDENIKFRPFLVKEQKILLLAYESQDVREILTAVIQCLENCTAELNVRKLATFDVDYLFTQIRSKSVGESSEVISRCVECEHEHTVKIDLNEIKVDAEKQDMSIELNDDISLTMKYPTYQDIFSDKVILDESSSAAAKLFASLRSCIESIQTPDENILLKNETTEEIEDFISSLNDEQYKKINDFVDNIPTMKYAKQYNCKACESNNEVVIEGLQDFF